jgi:beta-galactosidase
MTVIFMKRFFRQCSFSDSMKRATFSIALFIGGLLFGAERSAAQPVFFTPEKNINEPLRRAASVSGFEFVRLHEDETHLEILPNLKAGWRWVAGKNIDSRKGKYSFFIHDGYVYLDYKGDVRSNFRRAKARKDVTAQVQSNVFHIAFQAGEGKDEEVWIFIASDEAKQVSISCAASLFGEENVLTYALAAGESRLLRIQNAKQMREWMPLAQPRPAALRERLDFTNDWRFMRGDKLPSSENLPAKASQPGFSDNTWQAVTLPHTWNVTDMFDDRRVNDGLDIYANYFRGDGWYRKTFTAPSATGDKNVMLEFEAANQVADVWLNGAYLGSHTGGYMNFKFDITGKLRLNKPNVVLVKVNNAFNVDIPPHVGDFNFHGGLTREAALHLIPKTHVSSVAISTPDVSAERATVRVVTDVQNDAAASFLMLVTNILTPDGYIAATMKSVQRVERGERKRWVQESRPILTPHLWSTDAPLLYQTQSLVYELTDTTKPHLAALADCNETAFGFRFFSFDAARGFFLNGVPLKLRGVNLHQDRQGFGMAVPDSVRVQDLRLFKAMGINFVRLAHYPHDESMLAECDKLGILVYTEIPFVNTVGRERFFENAKMMLRELIARDRNHPSIIFWGVANETVEHWITDDDLRHVRKLIGDLHQIAKTEDPSRLTIQAQNTIADTTTAALTDVIGRNRYSGWYSKSVDDFGKQIDEDRRTHPHWRVLISEYGADAKRGFHVDKPERMDFSETYQTLFHESYLNQINEREWIAGGAVWNGADFASHAKMGNIPRINEKGLVDYNRVPKDAYYLYQSQWSKNLMAYIVSHTRTVLTGKADEVKPIRVYSNGERVELFHNGKSLGTQTMDKKSSGKKEVAFVWAVRLSAGEHEFIVKAERGVETVTDRLRVTYRIETTSNAEKLKAGETDATGN